MVRVARTVSSTSGLRNARKQVSCVYVCVGGGGGGVCVYVFMFKGGDSVLSLCLPFSI